MSNIPGVPEPVFHLPPPTSRSLEAWLAPERVGAASIEAPTRLRQIADNRAVDVAAAAASVAGGIVCALFGAYWSFFGRIVAPVVAFTLLGALLLVVGILLIRRSRRRLPKEGGLRVVRGPGTARGGIIAAASIWGLIAALTMGAWGDFLERDSGQWAAVIAFYLFFALLLVTCFIVPAVVLGRSRDSLRRIVAEDPAYRALLEQDRLSWRPRYGDQMFGPL